MSRLGRALGFAASAAARMIVGLVGLSLANGLSLNTVPLANGMWSERLHLSSSVIGALVTEQVMVTSLVAIILSARLHRLDARAASLPASCALIASSVALAFASSVPVLALLCFVSGAAVGVLNAGTAAAIAATSRPDRTYALASIVTTVFVAALTIAIGVAAESYGVAGLFLSQALVAVGALAMARLTPARAPDAPAPTSPPLLSSLRSPIVFSAVALQVGTLGIWAFTERIGHTVGFSTAEVSGLLAVTTLIGVLGGVVAAMIARPGREMFWAVTGTIAFGLASSMLAASPNAPIYIAAMTAQAFTYVFVMPFITAVAVGLDKSGGLAAASQGWATLIGSAAPAIAGQIVKGGAYGGLAILSIVGSAVSVAALVVAARKRPVEKETA